LAEFEDTLRGYGLQAAIVEEKRKNKSSTTGDEQKLRTNNVIASMSVNLLLTDAEDMNENDQMEFTLMLGKLAEVKENLCKDKKIRESEMARKRVMETIDGVTAAFARTANVGAPPPLKMKKGEFQGMNDNFFSKYVGAGHSASQRINEIKQNWRKYSQSHQEEAKKNKEKAIKLREYAKKNLCDDSEGYCFYFDIEHERSGLPELVHGGGDEKEDVTPNKEKEKYKQRENGPSDFGPQTVLPINLQSKIREFFENVFTYQSEDFAQNLNNCVKNINPKDLSPQTKAQLRKELIAVGDNLTASYVRAYESWLNGSSQIQPKSVSDKDTTKSMDWE